MRLWRLTVVLSVGALLSAAAALAKDRKELDAEVKDVLQVFLKNDSSLKHQLGTAYGYVVFPTITKGAIGIGAANGQGEVFEKGKLIGIGEVTQVTLGVQLGGQQYAELILFENKSALDDFKNDKLALSAEASAVAAAEGASARAKYQQGVMVITFVKNGLMFEASVGGQKFEFTPLEK